VGFPGAFQGHGTVAVARSARGRRLLADPPDLLLTTPESVAAMPVSARVDPDRHSARLRAIVVDEVHAFGGEDAARCPDATTDAADPPRR
jgi:hypothetical protein